jgi:hypothetical protein
MSAAQNQHYVPKFILRQFLSDAEKEQVSVYDKHTAKTFTTSIKNVMAERRFNDFKFEDWRVSFEDTACHIEDQVLPMYRRVLERRRLDMSVEERAGLAFFIAFQFLRTKGYRSIWTDMEDALRTKIEAMGGRLEDLEGWEPQTEDRLKLNHLVSMRDSLGEFAQVIAKKDLLLIEPSPGRSFYLGDNPVALHNNRKFGPYGNLGFAVPGIEIYLPLSSSLLLAAWCPSIVGEIRKARDDGRRDRQNEMYEALKSGRISFKEAAEITAQLRPIESLQDEIILCLDEGVPLPSDDKNMDYYNSIQTAVATRYIICQSADFDLAHRHNSEFPELRRGRRMKVN